MHPVPGPSALFFLIPVCLAIVPGHSTEPPPPRWIQPESSATGAPAEARRTFSVPPDFQTASLRVTADGALDVVLNGTTLAELEPFDPVRELDARLALRAGENELRLIFPGDARAALVFTIDGAPIAVTGPGWTAPNNGPPPRDAGPVDPLRWNLDRMPDIAAFEEYNQWKESLDGAAGAEAAFSPLPPGFALERLHAARPEEGSWISMTFDPQGRLIVAREDRGLLRFTLPAPGAPGDFVPEVIDDTLLECRGLLWAHDSLYVHANRSKGLYRLRDRDGDGRFEDVRLLRETPGSTGHGRNDLALGPDGLIYAICGDNVGLPEGALDRTPGEPEGTAHLGHLARTDADGTFWEILCRGLRNPYGIDFNPDGEWFTFDADNEGDVGLPLYRPTRVNHLLSGANYGWHQAAPDRSWPVHAPDSLPTTFDIGRGSPTAVKFGTRSAFPSPYREALFILDWAYGRIIAVHLQPRGASYQASAETFLRGRPLNVTDLDFAPDGSMLFITGGRKTQSALYRIRHTAPAQAPRPAPEDSWQASRSLRRELEALHTTGPDATLARKAWKHTGHEDPWIRHAARVALEHQPTDLWRAWLDEESPALHRLTALLALARAGTEADRTKAVSRVARLPTAGWRRTAKLTALRVYELGLPDSGSTPARQAIAQVQPWFPDPSPEVNRELAGLLVRLEAPGAVETAFHLLAAAPSQPERLHYLETLSRARTGWTPDQRRRYWTALDHAARFSKGDRLMAAFFTGLRERFLQGVDPAAHPEFFAATGSVEEPPESLPAPRSFVKAWRMDDFAGAADLAAGNPERGARLYGEALCSRCHQFGSHGYPVGPDLTVVAGRFSPADLLRSIVEPSHVVAEPYRIAVVTRKDGSTVLGRVVQDDFRESKLHLAVDPFDLSKQEVIAKGDIASFEESPVSPMPEGLLNTLSKEEVLDLLAFLRQG